MNIFKGLLSVFREASPAGVLSPEPVVSSLVLADSSAVEEVELEDLGDRQPRKRKLVQINLMSSFGISMSNTHKDGSIVVVPPGLVEPQPQYSCPLCKRTFTSRCNIVQHIPACARIYDARDEDGGFESDDGRLLNRGSDTRSGHSHAEKMKAVIFYDNYDHNFPALEISLLFPLRLDHPQKNKPKVVEHGQETEAVQPIDRGAGSTVKMIIGQEQDKWLDEDDNLAAWEGDPASELQLTAKYRRILITKWVGEAWHIFTTDPKYSMTMRKCFVHTGALITADGSNDADINPIVGVPYSVPELIDLVIEPEDHLQDAAPLAPPAPEQPDNAVLPAPVVVADAAAAGPALAPAVEDGDNENGGDDSDDDEEEDEDSEDDDADDGVDPEDNLALLDEKESWVAALEFAAGLDPALTPLDETVGVIQIPKRRTGHALLFIKGEWEVVKIQSNAATINSLYRYKVLASGTYGYCPFGVKFHGRYTPIQPEAERWVCLKNM